ncbi:deoxyribose-phosphate aldolase [Myroides sp. LJL119]
MLEKDLKEFMDSTYLKTPQQAGLSVEDNNQQVKDLVNEAVSHGFKLAMIRPEQVSMARELIDNAKSSVLVGTVIDFPLGDAGLQEKLDQAQKAIADGADELDFVVDYNSYIKGDLAKVKQEVKKCTALGLKASKVVKWIIETAALNEQQIAGLTKLIKEEVIENFPQEVFEKVYVKSSTGFFKTQDGKPNGATYEAIKIMLENAGPLPVKASGGIKDQDTAIKMINLGVKRLGTSSAKVIVDGFGQANSY